MDCSALRVLGCKTGFLPAGAQTPAVSDSRAAGVEAVSRARFAGLVAHDSGSLTRYYAPGFRAVNETGKPETIGFLARIMKVTPQDFAITPFDYRIFVSKDGTQAVAYHKSHDVWGGQKSDTEYTEVYQKINGRWLLRFEQYASIQVPTLAPGKK